ncbi:hypothetical protein [Streptomyces abikoensis]|uniref:Lipoprotein n=1 Tax=Streptomyces abikoensis TaxID=97398 RepID=A0ABW7T4V9_9ACTN
MGPLCRRTRRRLLGIRAATHRAPFFSFSQHAPEFVINSKRKALVALGCTALIASATVACNPLGDDSASPAIKVKNAFAKLGEQHALSANLHLDASADQIYTAMRGKKDFERADADMLAGLTLTYGVSTDRALKDIEGQDDDSLRASVALTKAGQNPMLEARTAGKNLYARVDVKGLSDLARQSGNGDSDMVFLDQMVRRADELPPSMGAVKAALKGQWISIDPDSFPDDDTPSAKLDAKDQKKALDAISNAVTSNAKFKDAGTSGGAEHVKITLPAKKTAKDIATGLKPLADQLGERLTNMSRNVKDVPDRNITVDVAIRDGIVSGITLDLAELDDKIKGTLPLAIDINGHAGKVEIPADAKPITPADIMAAAMATYGDQAPVTSSTRTQA